MGKIAPFGFLNSAAPPPPPIQYIYAAGGNEATNTRTARTDRLNIANDSVSTFNLYRRAGNYTSNYTATHGFFKTWDSSFGSWFPGNPSGQHYSAIVFASQTYVSFGLFIITRLPGMGCINLTSRGYNYRADSINNFFRISVFNYSNNTLSGYSNIPYVANLSNNGRLAYTSNPSNNKIAYTGNGSGTGQKIDTSFGTVSFTGTFTGTGTSIGGTNAINTATRGFRNSTDTKGNPYGTEVAFSTSTESAGGLGTPVQQRYVHTGYTATAGYAFRGDSVTARLVSKANLSVYPSSLLSLGNLCAYQYEGFSVMQDTGIQ